MTALDEYAADMVREGWTFRPTTDDWAPNFPNGLVAVKVIAWPWRHECAVRITGADDTMMGIDVADRAEAERVLKSLPAIVTMADLRERGFEWA